MVKIILEGCDGTGKSTLAKRLADIHQLKIVSFSYPKTEDEKKHMVEMYEDFLMNNDDCIMDRSWYSEMVYGPILRKEVNVTDADMVYLESLLLANGGGYVIHCTDKLSDLYKRLKRRGDDYLPIDFNTIDKIRVGYHKLLERRPHVIPVLRYKIND